MPVTLKSDSGNLVNIMTGSELKITVNEEGKFDMCKAIDDMRKESRDEGRIETLIVLVRKGLLSLYDAAKEAGLTPDEFSLKMKGFI